MKIITLSLVLFFYIQYANGQENDFDSFKTKNNKLLAKCFDSLNTIAYIDTSSVWNCNLCSLLSIVYLDGTKDSLFHKSVFLRLEQIAYKHFEEGNPIYIIGTGMNSFDKAEELNNKDDSTGVFYLSFGNTCLSTDLFRKGINHVNKTTLKLIEK